METTVNAAGPLEASVRHLRCLAEDLHSLSGHNRYAAALSHAADEIERLSRPGYMSVPVEPTTDMLYAMAECDGWQRGDRDHPGLTRWEDYWRMALSVLVTAEKGRA